MWPAFAVLACEHRGGRALTEQRFAIVWDAIEDTPEQAENMKLRATLMTALKDRIARSGMSQAQAAELLGVTQPRVSDLVRGKINPFGLDAWVNMATTAGLHVELRVREVAGPWSSPICRASVWSRACEGHPSSHVADKGLSGGAGHHVEQMHTP